MTIYKCICSFYTYNSNGNLNKKVSCQSLWSVDDVIEIKDNKGFFAKKVRKEYILRRLKVDKKTLTDSVIRVSQDRLDDCFRLDRTSMWGL